ncbi:glycoside hydrolase family 31 protein [Pengzhenrongella sicca]|uniref:Family 31 glucosidase n=1 Tax=Pengzhenrongella sicca TaxID=2819238 RepID=A0A8A4ZNQ1_9MICO|nr:TIM-barrel domain-containing protein [Pengzhenrongella sicca]QTE31178.1 family 31 glucosidase [Pengzhenrongella sicca]
MTADVFELDGTALVWRGDGETVRVEPWGADSVRVRSAVMADVVESGFALLPQPATDASIDVDGDVARLTNGNLTAVLTARSFHSDLVGYRVHRCELAFYNQHGTLLFKELDPGGSLHLKARDLRPHLGGDFRITAAFEADPAEKLYGMGQYQQHILDIKGSAFELAHRNSQASVPFVLSSAGYGFLWHNPAIGRANFALNRTEWVAESSKQLDYWVTAGDTPAAITAAYADATGHAPMMPEHGLGFWQCKLRYWNQEQLLEVAREHTRRGLPLDVIVADFFHWPQMGDFRFDAEFWPDPQAMVDELRGLGVELMVSVWPQVSIRSENFAAMKKNNLLVRSERGIDMQMQFEGPSVFLDPTNPATREFLWATLKRNYFDLGIKTFWLDEAEPEYGVYDFDNFRYHLGTNVQVGNIYPQAFSRALYEGQRSAGQEDIVNLVRCAWAGSQRYGALVWSGDIHSTFEDYRRQITAGIHMGVAGIPWFTTDIGGFHDGDITDPGFRELLIRWFQFGTFCPVMRLHGDRLPGEPVQAADGSPRLASGGGNELWSFGDDVYEILAGYVHLREAMRPYTRELMAAAHESGQPVMRGMFHEFPDQAPCWDLADQYMYGPDLLVAPVIVPGATSREVYLPAGATWTDLHSGAVLAGGGTVVVDAPLAVIPVFARDGSHPELVGRI